MSDQTLLLLLDEVRSKTLLILDATPAEFALRAPPDLGNHILRYAGHSYVVVESLAMRAMGLQPEIPEGWFEMFSWDSRPALIAPDRWPTLPEVVDRLRVQQERLRGVTAAYRVSNWTAPQRTTPPARSGTRSCTRCTTRRATSAKPISCSRCRLARGPSGSFALDMAITGCPRV